MFGPSMLAAAAAFLAVAPSIAHMDVKYPEKVLAQDNPFLGDEQPIDTYTAPMSGREQFPCRDPRVIAALGTEAGSPVDTWAAGSTQTITLEGGAFHGGGSCQYSLSYDSGETFKVIKSFIGSCPLANGETTYDVTIPADAPSGDVLFAWTWFNHIGNREMYMNCAVVTIGGASKRDLEAFEARQSVAFDDRPNIFVANIDGTSGCQTAEGIDVDFPNPGPDVERNTETPGLYIDESLCSDPDNTGAGTPGPVGDGTDSGGDTGSGDSSSSSAVEEPTSAAGTEPTSTDAGAVEPTTDAGSATSVPGGVFITTTPAATETEASPTSAVEVSTDPSTFVTSTKTDTTPTDAAGTDTETSAVPSATASPGSGTSEGAFTEGTACDNEGAWNCIDGSSFQRCASGMWSAVISMAAGTTCESGVSETFVMHRKRGGPRIVPE